MVAVFPYSLLSIEDLETIFKLVVYIVSKKYFLKQKITHRSSM